MGNTYNTGKASMVNEQMMALQFTPVSGGESVQLMA